jgi:hypothetical protein
MSGHDGAPAAAAKAAAAQEHWLQSSLLARYRGAGAAGPRAAASDCSARSMLSQRVAWSGEVQLREGRAAGRRQNWDSRLLVVHPAAPVRHPQFGAFHVVLVYKRRSSARPAQVHPLCLATAEVSRTFEVEAASRRSHFLFQVDSTGPGGLRDGLRSWQLTYRVERAEEAEGWALFWAGLTHEGRVLGEPGRGEGGWGVVRREGTLGLRDGSALGRSFSPRWAVVRGSLLLFYADRAEADAAAAALLDVDGGGAAEGEHVRLRNGAAAGWGQGAGGLDAAVHLEHAVARAASGQEGVGLSPLSGWTEFELIVGGRSLTLQAADHTSAREWCQLCEDMGGGGGGGQQGSSTALSVPDPLAAAAAETTSSGRAGHHPGGGGGGGGGESFLRVHRVAVPKAMRARRANRRRRRRRRGGAVLAGAGGGAQRSPGSGADAAARLPARARARCGVRCVLLGDRFD